MTELTLFIGLDVYTRRRFRLRWSRPRRRRSALLRDDRHTPDSVRTLCKKLSRDGPAAALLLRGGAVWLRRTPAADAARASLRRGGAGANPTQGRRPGENGPARRDDAGADAAGWAADRGVVPDEAHEAMRDLVRLRSQRCATCARRASSC